MAERNAASAQVANRGVTSGFGLLEALGRRDFALLADSSGTWVEELGQYEAFSPSTGAYEALVASGDLELLPDDGLKRSLAEFFGSFEDVRATEEGLRNAQDLFFLSDDFADAMGIHRLLGYPDALGQTVSPGRESLERWATSDGFLNGVAWISLSHQSALEDYAFLQAEIDRILPALAQRPARGF